MPIVRCANRNCKKNKDGHCQELSIVLDEGKYEGDDEMRCLDYEGK